MTTSVHKNLTGADLHEPKGADTALVNQVYVSNGSGSGVWTDVASVISNTSWNTGDAKLTFTVSAPSGWILVNDGTIGDGSSGATTRANADTSALFTLLYGLPIGLTVSGGRGASASADYAAHKTIQVPLALGRVLGVAGAGSGLTSRAVGSNVGSETYTLLRSDLPNVAPTFAGSSGSVNVTATAASLNGGTTFGGVASTSGAGVCLNSGGGASAGQLSSTGSFTPSGTVQSLNGGVVQTSTNNMQPSTFLNLLIKL